MSAVLHLRADLRRRGLPPPPQLDGTTPRQLFNPVILAYLGDAVWEVRLSTALLLGRLLRPCWHVGVTSHACYRAAQVLVRQHVMAQQQRSRPQLMDAHSLTRAAARHANAKQQAAYHDRLAAASEPPQDAQARTASEAGPAAHVTSSLASADEDSMPGPGPKRAKPSSAQQPALVLTSEELDVLRWARNSSAVSPPKGTDSRTYKKATALEALVRQGHAPLSHSRTCPPLAYQP